jgi:hypothetical protein
MRRAFRLAFAMQRFELRALLGGALLLAIVGLGLAWQIRAARAEELECYRTAPPPVEGSQTDVCPEFRPRRELLESAAGIVQGGAMVSPFVIGLFLGVPIVAREVESKTAGIAWSLSRSRRRWLVQRAAPVLAVVAAGTLAVGIASDVLTHAMPWAEGAEVGFSNHGARGPLVAVRGVAVFGLGLALGALVPRQLPALLLAAGFTAALLTGVVLLMDEWLRSEAEPLGVEALQQGAAPMMFGAAFRDDATGELVSVEDYYRDNPDIQTDEPPGMSWVYYTVPGSRYGDFVLRESAIWGAATILTLGTTALVVSRRRP